MQNKEICYGWLVFCKKFLINSWKFVLKKYSLNSHHLYIKPKILEVYSQFFQENREYGHEFHNFFAVHRMAWHHRSKLMIP